MMNPMGWMKKKPNSNSVYSDAVISMADYLISRGFRPEEAMKTAEGFWKKNQDKLNDVV